jgi:hypothetical protein
MFVIFINQYYGCPLTYLAINPATCEAKGVREAHVPSSSTVSLGIMIYKMHSYRELVIKALWENGRILCFTDLMTFLGSV